jgi:probable HAF family extracellular repeat protein
MRGTQFLISKRQRPRSLRKKETLMANNGLKTAYDEVNSKSEVPSYTIRPYAAAGCCIILVGLATPPPATAQDAFHVLGTLPGDNRSRPVGISADGSVVVGQSKDANWGNEEAFRWEGGGMIGLGFLPGDAQSNAIGISADGSAVIGVSGDANWGNQEAFRWEGGGMTGLGFLPGDDDSYPVGISADGSVVVGRSSDGTQLGTQSFRWNTQDGMQSVREWLVNAGVNVAPSFVLAFSSGVSADGSTIIGQGYDSSGSSIQYEAFLARVSSSGSGAVSLIDLQASLLDGAVGSTAALTIPNLLINGAHSRPLSKLVEPGQRMFWTGGDFGRDEHGARDGTIGLAEIGTGKRYGWGQVNLSYGRAFSSQSMPLNGSSQVQGSFLSATAMVPINESLWATFTGYGYKGDARITRGYLNAGLPVSSTGEADSSGWALRARLEWPQAVKTANAAYSPYIDLTQASSTLQGYTETGGGFPAIYNARTEMATELRIGTGVERPFGEASKLFGTIEGAHRFQENGAGVSGNVVGLSAFNFAGAPTQQNWLRAGIGIERPIGAGVASLSGNGTTRGEAPSGWLAMNWKVMF